MERSTSLTLRIAVALVMFLASAAGATKNASAPERHLVLVGSAASAAINIPVANLRRAYLGIPVVHEKVAVRPLLNATDPLLYKVFLQKIIFMSHRTYERHVLSQVFRFGGTRPRRIEDLDRLRLRLLEQSGAVTFMWEETAREFDDLRIMIELWHGTVD